MSKVDAERALAIYKTFSRQTEAVVSYLQVARQYEHATRLEIPKLKHAPTSLTASLEEYLNDPDFDINRQQYLAQKGGNPFPAKGESSRKPTLNNGSSSAAAVPATKVEPKAPAPDLIDFFASIEQQSSAAQPQPLQNGQQIPQYQTQQQGFQGNQVQPQQQTGFASTNPFAQMAAQQPQPQPQPQQQNFTGFIPQPQAQPSFDPHQAQNMQQAQPQPFQQQQQQQPFMTGQQQQQPFMPAQ